jgi:hypothetical protein
MATVTRGFLNVVVTTRYQPRTDVERWQMQDRLRVRLSRVAGAARPRFFEAGGGRLAFRLWLGMKPADDVLAQLQTIDDAERGAGG